MERKTKFWTKTIEIRTYVPKSASIFSLQSSFFSFISFDLKQKSSNQRQETTKRINKKKKCSNMKVKIHRWTGTWTRRISQNTNFSSRFFIRFFFSCSPPKMFYYTVDLSLNHKCFNIAIDIARCCRYRVFFSFLLCHLSSWTTLKIFVTVTNSNRRLEIRFQVAFSSLSQRVDCMCFRSHFAP